MGFATDSLLNSSAVALPTHNSNWSDANGRFDTVASNGGVQANDQAVDLAFWNAGSFSPDQYAEIELDQPASGTDYIGPAVRCSYSNPNNSGYWWYAALGANAWYFGHLGGGSYTVIDSGTTTGWASGDVLRLEAQGTTLRLKRNGVQIGSDYTGRTEYSSGQPGISGYHNSFASGTNGKNWVGSDLTLAANHLTGGANSGTNGNGTTDSITPTANALILVTVEAYKATANSTPSVSGNGITYELVGSCADFTNGTGWKKIYLFRGMSASPSAGVIDITSSNDYVAWSVDEITGVVPGANGANAIGQVITGTRDPSGTSLDLTFSPALPTSSGAFGCIANYGGSTAFSPRSGWAELYDNGAADGPQTQWRSEGDSICGWTFSSDEAGGVAIELKAPSGFRAWDFRPDVQQILHNPR